MPRGVNNSVCVCFRLLNAFAEEQATEDAVYYMGEALRKGVVELDVFLKVRTLHVNVLIFLTLCSVAFVSVCRKFSKAEASLLVA